MYSGDLKIENNNFKIKKDEIKSQYVKSVDENVINLNTITYGKNIEIKIPVEFPKQDMINVEQLNKETSVTLNGMYKDENDRETKINGQIKTRLIWTDDANISVNQDIEKYMLLNDKETLLQQKVDVQVEENKLPIQSENLKINVPVIKETKPSRILILVDGNKLSEENYKYDEEGGILEIINNNIPNEEGKINWNKGKNEYKIIYIYEEVGLDAR